MQKISKKGGRSLSRMIGLDMQDPRSWLVEEGLLLREEGEGRNGSITSRRREGYDVVYAKRRTSD